MPPVYPPAGGLSALYLAYCGKIAYSLWSYTLWYEKTTHFVVYTLFYSRIKILLPWPNNLTCSKQPQKGGHLLAVLITTLTTISLFMYIQIQWIFKIVDKKLWIAHYGLFESPNFHMNKLGIWTELPPNLVESGCFRLFSIPNIAEIDFAWSPISNDYINVHGLIQNSLEPQKFLSKKTTQSTISTSEPMLWNYKLKVTYNLNLFSITIVK